MKIEKKNETEKSKERRMKILKKNQLDISIMHVTVLGLKQKLMKMK